MNTTKSVRFSGCPALRFPYENVYAFLRQKLPTPTGFFVFDLLVFLVLA
jgi:hypothetical protein